MSQSSADRSAHGSLPGVSGEWIRLLELNPDPLLIVHRTGRIVFANPAAEQVFGRRRAQLLGKSVIDGPIRLAPVGGEPFAPDAHPFLVLAGDRGSPRAMELTLLRDNGERAILSCHVAPLSDTGGGESGIIASLRDVTETHRTAERERIVAEVGRILVSSLDAEPALTGVARASVPGLADGCGFHLPDGKGGARCVAAVGLTAHPDGPAAVTEVLASGRPFATRESGTDALSLLVLPLVARGQTLGAVELCTRGPIDPADIEVAERLAHVVALAVDNDRLRRAAQRALDDAAAQHKRAASILESISDAFWAVDQEGRFTYVNHHAEKVLGHRREDLLGKRIADLLSHQFGVRVRDEMQASQADPASRVFEVEAPDSDTWFEVHIYPADDGLSVYLHDVGERRRAAEAQRLLMDTGTALAASLDSEQTLKRAARVAVPTLADFCTVDLIGPNDALERVAAASRDQADEEKLRRLGRRFPPDPRLPSATLRAVRSGESVAANDLTRGRLLAGVPDPELLRLVQELGARSVLIVPLTARGRRLGVVTFAFARSGRRYTPEICSLAEDVARRAAIAIDNARLYEEAQESSRSKSNFISVMSHEFRTPLTAIVGYTDLLTAEVAGPLTDKQRQQLGRIKQSAWHLTQLIEEVLTFSRVDAGREMVAHEVVDLAEIAAKAAALIEPVAHEKNLRLLVDIPPHPLPAHSDSGKVRQILINLLSNAIKFTETGEVRLRVWQADNRFQFQIQDTGIGIAQEHRERIFDSFWQVEQGPTRTVGGTGLGLTITRRLAHLLGGDVEVVSEVGRGSTFTVWLPVPERSPTLHPLPGARAAAAGRS